MSQRLLNYTVLERSSYNGSKVTQLYCTRKEQLPWVKGYYTILY